MDKLIVEGEVGYVVWSNPPAAPIGTDTYIVRDGKIVLQTFVVYMPG